MSEASAEYNVVGQAKVNKLMADGSVQPGYEIKVTDLQTGVTFPVFLPDDKYSAENARQLINFQLQQVRSVHALTN